MNWIRTKDELPVIPEGKYGISVIVACFDPCYDEINSGKGYHINRYVSYSTGEYGPDFYEPTTNDEWMPVVDYVTHWMYLPKPPEYDPEVLNPILQFYHDHALPQSPLKQI
jgi:hypothetical protein